MVDLALEEILEMCEEKESLESRVTPRYFIEETRSKTEPFKE